METRRWREAPLQSSSSSRPATHTKSNSGGVTPRRFMASREAHAIRYQSMNQSRTAGMYLHLRRARADVARRTQSQLAMDDCCGLWGWWGAPLSFVGVKGNGKDDGNRWGCAAWLPKAKPRDVCVRKWRGFHGWGVYLRGKPLGFMAGDVFERKALGFHGWGHVLEESPWV